MSTNRIAKSRLMKFLIVLLTVLIVVPFFPTVNNSAYATTSAVVVNVTSYLYIRRAPVNGAVVGTLQPGARVTVLDSTSYPGWYQIQSGNVTGYSSADYLQIETNAPSTPAPSVTTTTTPAPSIPMQGDAFEASIAAFPESYKYRLRELHTLHPNWTFNAVDCGDWNTAVALESSNGVSLVPLTSDRSWLDLNDRGVKDSPNWVNASDAVISYYMDPRNMLSEGNVFQFMDLNYPVGNLSISENDIAGALNGTFMSGTSRNFTVDGATALYPYQAFALAAQESGVNPIFLATHVIQECGANGSSSSSGASGYYNLYNIGAYSDVNNAAMVGLNFAHYGVNPSFNATYSIPWDTAGKSCVYGAKWIADNYVKKGQNSLYFMRFNLATGGSYTRGTHQYMTALQSCSSESSRMYQAYKRAGIIDAAINFRIPVYSNMPASASPYPAMQGVTGYPAATSTPSATTGGSVDQREQRVRDFVTRLYRLALSREPDGSGFEFWVNSIVIYNSTGRQVSMGFLNSPEFQSKNLSDEDFLRYLYSIYLDRQPDNSGFNFWLECLQNGSSRQSVIDGFLRSPEFCRRCEEAGMRPY